MKVRSLSHLTDGQLLRELSALRARNREVTAEELLHLGEVDDRKLFLPQAHRSMFRYCVRVLRMSEDTAFKRIRAARAARRFPVIYAAVAEGRLTLTAVMMLAPHLTAENAAELLAAATHRTNAQIQELLAGASREPDVAASVTALPDVAAGCQVNWPYGRVESAARGSNVAVRPVVGADSNGPRSQLPCGHIRAHARLTPLAPQRFALQCTLGQSAHDKLRRAQELLGHRVASRDLDQVLELALDALIAKLEKRTFAATDRPRKATRPTAGTRHIPAHVKRAVSQRDGGQCTFTSESGRALRRAGGSRVRSHRRSRPRRRDRPSRTCDCAAARTTSTRPNARSGAASCRRSAKRRSEGARSKRPSVSQ